MVFDLIKGIFKRSVLHVLMTICARHDFDTAFSLCVVHAGWLVGGCVADPEIVYEIFGDDLLSRSSLFWRLYLSRKWRILPIFMFPIDVYSY